MTGVTCDKKVAVKGKHRVYMTVIKPTMAYGTECWTIKKKDEMVMNKIGRHGSERESGKGEIGRVHIAIPEQ